MRARRRPELSLELSATEAAQLADFIFLANQAREFNQVERQKWTECAPVASGIRITIQRGLQLGDSEAYHDG